MQRRHTLRARNLRVSLRWSQGREFTLVFRSFGADVAEVVEEMNAFATGQHPCYPDVRATLPLPYCACTATRAWQRAHTQTWLAARLRDG
jgi:hypothetical protein